MASGKTLTEKTIRIPLVGSPTNREQLVEKDQRFVNCFPEVIKNKITETDRIYLRKRFGTEKYIQPSGAAGEPRGLFGWNNKIYSVIGDKLYEDTTAKQTLTTSTGACGFTDTSGTTDYLFFCDGVKGYVIDLAGVVTEVTDVDFPTPHVTTPVYMDGYIFLLKTNGDIYNSDVDNVLGWSTSNFIVPESFPDICIALARQNNQVVALSEYSVEFYYDAGTATGSPLQVTAQATLQFGCASIGSVCEEEALVVFVSQSKTGGLFLTAIEGFKPSTISTEPINRILDAEGDSIQDSWAVLIRTGGHLFYVLNLPFQRRTLVYDFSLQTWHEWTWTAGETQDMFPFGWRTTVGTSTYWLHESNGYVYEAKSDLYQDDGQPIQVLIQTSRFDGDTTKLKFMSKLELVGDFQETTSPMSVRYSDDDYKTWSNPRTVDLMERTALWRLGSFRRRALLLIHEANTPCRLESIELNLDMGTH